MDQAKTFSGIDFSRLKPKQVRRLIEDLYKGYPGEQRDFQLSPGKDRRQLDRRQADKFVLLDSRSCRSRRQSAGRRGQDENPGNKHKVGIDYYI